LNNRTVAECDLPVHLGFLKVASEDFFDDHLTGIQARTVAVDGVCDLARRSAREITRKCDAVTA